MGRGQVAAQAQAQHQTNISHTESLELVRCLLRVSIFHVSYLRGLFPEKSFKGVDMKNLDDMHIKMLLPSCEESRRLVDWVEGGVYDAIKRGYLKNLFFGISTDPDGTELLEEYIFSFKYGDGKVSMEVNALATDDGKKQRAKKGEFKQASAVGGAGGSAPVAEAAKADLNTVRYQVCRLIRMLVQVCRTLDKVPAERFLFMKLTYQDHTPDEYEPPYFVPVDESGIGHFKRAPFAMAVGRVATDHHSVSLKVKSTLDSCDDELVDGDVGEAGVDGHRSGGRSGDGAALTDRVTAQAQPSAGSVGSGDVTNADTAAAATTGGVAVADDDAVTGGGGMTSGPAVQAPPATPTATAARGDGEGDGGDAMEYGDDAATPLGVEPTAPAPTPTSGISGLTGNLENPSALGDTTAGGHEQQQQQPLQLQLEPEAEAEAEAEAATGGADMEVDGGADADATAATAATDGAAPRGDDGEQDDVTEAPEAEDYTAMCEFVRGRSQITLRQMRRQFSAMSQGALDGYVDRLKAQGLLTVVPGARTTFRVAPQQQQQQQPAKGGEAQSQPPEAGVQAAAKGRRRQGGSGEAEEEDAAAAIAKHLDGLSMEPARAGGDAAGTAAAAAADGPAAEKPALNNNNISNDDRRRSRDQADRSRGGRLESAQAAAGDEVTGSEHAAAGGGGSDEAMDAAAAADEPHIYINDSQQSNPTRARGGRVRKASYVADPIGQGAVAKKPRTAAAAAAAPATAGGGTAGARGGKAAAAAAKADTGAGADAGDQAAAPTTRGTRGGSRLASMRR
ncbi:hypothetical protein PLESTF_001770500 [Pleodorina starrii]|nr:hypothetical protein PLESTF_001770500 [Pleodorina starrii]